MVMFAKAKHASPSDGGLASAWLLVMTVSSVHRSHAQRL